MKKQFKTFYLFLLITIFLFIFLNKNLIIVRAITCQEKAGYCASEDAAGKFGCDNWGGYFDKSLSGCPQGQVCCVSFITADNDNTQDNKGLPREIQSPTSIIPYEFETGIPGIAKKGETLKTMTLAEFVKLLIRYVFRISGILAFVMIVYGGILYLISGGDAKKQKSAQEKIAGAVIGLILLFAFWLILNTINPDILRAPKISINSGGNGGENDSENGSDGGNGDGNSNTSKLASKILSNPNIKLYPGADKDLNDVVIGKPINVKENDPGDWKRNCEDQITDFATTIQTNLLKVVDNITKMGVWDDKCSSKYVVGPFISNHNYCYIDPETGEKKAYPSSHKDGKAFDITLLGKSSSDKECTAALLLNLCPNLSENKLKECNPYKFICTTTINGVKVGIVNEICMEEPHLHIQLYP